MKRFRIRDWAGNTMIPASMVERYAVQMVSPPEDFESFEDAEYFLSVVLDDKYEEERQEYYIEEIN